MLELKAFVHESGKTPAFDGPSVETGPGAKGPYEKRLHSHKEAAAGRPDSWILLP